MRSLTACFQRKSLSSFSIAVFLFALAPLQGVDAKERKVKETQIRYVTVKAQKKEHQVACLAKLPGTTRSRRGKLSFLSLADEQNTLSRLRGLSASKRKRLALLRALMKPSVSACKKPAPADHLNLSKFSGKFGRTEAQILLTRFAFGASPAQIDLAVRTGLDATIKRLTSYVEEPALDAQVADIECDSWLTGDPQAGSANRQCNPGNVNDLNRTGLRTGLLVRYLNSQNGFFHRLGFFLMDERLAVSNTAARDCERHAIRTYMQSVARAARSGNYQQYMRDMNNDHLMHLRWLDGGTNRGGLAVTPNENYAREFWELGTVAPTDLAGKPVYSDLDIAQAALAFTGFNIEELTVNGNYTCLASYVPLFHTPGGKTVFRGTPYQATVSDAEQLLQATFRHPRAAEHLAEDLWKEFVNPFATPAQIRELAQIIRDNDFNLLPVMRRLMSSRALYATRSRNSLIKHPLDLVIGYVKATGFPIYYRNIDGILARLEQQVLNPNTVFGWDPKYLAGQQLQIEWWNTFIDNFINVDIADLKNDYNWGYYQRFVADLHAAGRRTSGDVIDRVAADLGVPISAAQRAELDQMMNFTLSRYQCPSQCGGQPFRLIRNQYDTDPAATESGVEWNSQRRLRMLITALMELPEARTK